jgi:hypothetical protein
MSSFGAMYGEVVSTTYLERSDQLSPRFDPTCAVSSAHGQVPGAKTLAGHGRRAPIPPCPISVPGAHNVRKLALPAPEAFDQHERAVTSIIAVKPPRLLLREQR